MINGESIERAEHLIKILFEKGKWPDSALEHFDIEIEAFAQFNAFSVARVREMYPDIDPRHETAIATMFVHMFLVGVAIGRKEGYSTDSGLHT